MCVRVLCCTDGFHGLVFSAVASEMGCGTISHLERRPLLRQHQQAAGGRGQPGVRCSTTPPRATFLSHHHVQEKIKSVQGMA